MNRLALLFARRLLFSRRTAFLRGLNILVLLGVALSTAALVTVFNVMRGFQEELQQRWIGLNAHVTITPFNPEGAAEKKITGALLGWGTIKAMEPIVEGEVIVRSAAAEEALAAKLRGVASISPEFLERVESFPQDEERFSLWMGEDLAAYLDADPLFGSRVELLYPFGEIGPSGDWVPNKKTFSLSRTFRSGLYQWDAYQMLVPYDEAVRLLGEQGRESLQLRLRRFGDLAAVEKKLSALAPPPFHVETFAGQNRKLFSALKLERLAMGFILGLFALIAFLSLANSELLYLEAKRRDLAILRILGLKARETARLFLSLGGMLSGLGAVAGGVLGLAVSALLYFFPIPLPSTYYLDILPVRISPFFTAGVVLFGTFLGLGVSLFPALQTRKLPLLAVVREE